MVASKGVFGSRCLKSWVNSYMVIGECLGCFDVTGAILVATVSAAFSCRSSMFHWTLCNMCHAQMPHM